MSSGLTPAMLPDAAAMWRCGAENLSPSASPCRYLVPPKWAAIREAAMEFCDRLGAEAHRQGWTAPELFAVHPEHGTLRVDYCGALLLSGNKPVAVEASRIVFESGSA
ncbi:hypothetical protein, partial [Methylobacterium sp. J-076]|uniref:hypothetical protein n=1 Tax=Methylobacterium sp. J-076 TaxID=2836655 RepID=UPI001FB8DE89